MNTTVDTAIDPAPAPDVVEVVLRPFRAPSTRFRLAVAVLSALVVLGLAAWVYQLVGGMAVAGYTDRSFWAIYIADVVSFIGVSYGGAVVSAILMLAGATWRAPLVRIAEGVALVTVLVGEAFIIPHLGRPDRLLGMVTHANIASPVFWDMVAILTYTVATIVFFLLPLVPDTATLLATRGDELGRFRRGLYRFLSKGWTGSQHQRRVLHSAMTAVAVVIIPVAVSVHSVLGWAFSLVSRPGWHESIWAPYFVVAALYSGVALVIVVVAAFRSGYRLHAYITEAHLVKLAWIMLVLGALYVYLTFADLLPSAYVGEVGPSRIIYGELLGNDAPLFWVFVVVGTLAPIALVAIPRTRTVKGLVTASVLVIVGMWLKRLVMVVETSGYDRLTNSFGRMFGFTWVSISTTVAGVAAVALMLMLLFRLVPLLAITEIEEQADDAPPPARSGSDGAARLAGRAGAVVLLLAALAVTGTAKAPAAAADVVRAAPSSPVLVVTASETGTKNTLTATVTADGTPVKGALVNFYESTPMFAPGTNKVPVGSMETDEKGVASVTYVAAVTGPRTITANYVPDALKDPISGTTKLDVRQAVNPYRPDAPVLLGGAGRGLAVALFALVLTVLTILGTQVVRVRRSMRA